MIGDCSRCHHSIAYHVPIVGCAKCDCGEYQARPAARRLRFLAATLSAGLLMLCALACSRTLTPAQATAARAMVGPDCAALATGAAEIPVPIVSQVTGAIVALLCPTIAGDIISAETIVTVDGGVGATAPALVFTEGCVPAPVVGDPLGQWACPELAARVRDATGRRMAKGARK